MHIVVAVDGQARLSVVVADLPGGEAREEVGDEIEAFLSHDVFVGRDAVSLKDFVGRVAKLRFQGVLVVLQGRSLPLECLHGMGFEGVPACEQRHLGLLATLEHGIGTLGHEEAVEHQP